MRSNRRPKYILYAFLKLFTAFPFLIIVYIILGVIFIPKRLIQFWNVLVSRMGCHSLQVTSVMYGIQPQKKQKLLARLFIEFIDSCRPKYKNSNASVRWNEIDNLTDQNIINKIAIQDPSANVRGKAVARVTDHNILEQIIQTDDSAYVREEACRQITDQNILTKIALEGSSAKLRELAVNKLRNEVILVRIAKSSNTTDSVRIAAIKRLKNNDIILEEIARSGCNMAVRKEAIENLIDYATMVNIAKTDASFNIRKLVIEKTKKTSFKEQFDPYDIDLVDMWHCCNSKGNFSISEQDDTCIVEIRGINPSGFKQYLLNHGFYLGPMTDHSHGHLGSDFFESWKTTLTYYATNFGTAHFSHGEGDIGLSYTIRITIDTHVYNDDKLRPIFKKLINSLELIFTEDKQ